MTGRYVCIIVCTYVCGICGRCRLFRRRNLWVVSFSDNAAYSIGYFYSGHGILHTFIKTDKKAYKIVLLLKILLKVCSIKLQVWYGDSRYKSLVCSEICILLPLTYKNSIAICS